MILDLGPDEYDVYISMGSTIWYWGTDTSGVDSMFKANTRSKTFIRYNNMLYRIDFQI